MQQEWYGNIPLVNKEIAIWGDGVSLGGHILCNSNNDGPTWAPGKGKPEEGPWM